MQAYIDDSMNDGEVLVFGGLISTANDWEAFSVAWRQYLHEERIRVFKLKRAAPKHAERLYHVVCDHAKAALCFVVPILPLKESAARYGLSETPAAKPYLWAYEGVINSLARNQREWGLYESVDFIFDERPDQEKADVVDGWEVHLDTVPDEVRSIMGRRPTFADDEVVLPLQAADMWAGYCRRTWCENNGTIPEDGFPVPFGKRGDLPQLIQLWVEEDIDQELCSMAKDLSDIPGFLQRNPGALQHIRANPAARAFIDEHHPGLLEGDYTERLTLALRIPTFQSSAMEAGNGEKGTRQSPS